MSPRPVSHTGRSRVERLRSTRQILIETTWHRNKLCWGTLAVVMCTGCAPVLRSTLHAPAPTPQSAESREVSDDVVDWTLFDDPREPAPAPNGQTVNGPASVPDAAIVEPRAVATNAQLLQRYVWSVLGRDGALSATLSAGFDQWRGRPREWDLTGPGYVKRWASEYAESAIGDIAKYSVARLVHHDPSFTPCECTGVGRRLRHAIDSPFMARTRTGRRVPSPASLAGVIAGNVTSASTWYPTPLGARDGFKHAGMDLLAKIGIDVFQEFRPRRKS